MLSLDKLTEDELHRFFSRSSLDKAHHYVQRVQDPVRSGQTLSARVLGSDLYQVEVEVTPDGIQGNCACPYEWGGLCKHVGAVLLKWIHNPHSFGAKEASVASGGEYPIEVIPVQAPPTTRPKDLPDWLATPFAEHWRLEQQQLAGWLDWSKLQDMRDLARQWRWAVRGTRKAAVAQQVAEQMTIPGNIRQAELSLDEEHRQVLRALVLLFGDDKVVTEDLERVALTLGGPLKRHKQIAAYTQRLCDLGLALPGENKGNYLPPFQDFVPMAIARHLSPALAGVIPASTHLPVAGSAGAIRPADPGELVRTAHQIIMLLRQSPAPLRPPMPRPRMEKSYPHLTGWNYDPIELAQLQKEGKLQPYNILHLTVPPPDHSLPDEAIERLSPLAGGEARLEFIYALLLTAGIFQPGSPVTVWQETYTEFLRREEMVQQAILTHAYFQMFNWSTLWEMLRERKDLGLKRVLGYTYVEPGQLSIALRSFRHLVLRILAGLPDDRWVQMADLLPLMRAAWPRFDTTMWDRQRPVNVPGAWYLVRNSQPMRPGDPDDWEAAQGSFIRQMIAGPLHWLGLADLCFDGKALSTFRLRGLADLYWDRVEALPPPSQAADQSPAISPSEVVTTDALSVIVNPAAVNAQAHGLLDRIARLDVAKVGRFVYRLDARAACEAFESGVALPDLLDDWQRLLPIPMPDPIRDQLVAWWEAYGRVRIYEKLAIVEFGDEYALAEMKAVTSLEQYLVAEISPQLVIIRPEGQDTLIAELQKAGYTPKRTQDV